MKRLDGKAAVITGCNRGIGKAILEKFAKEGANIVACTRQMTAELEAFYQQKEKENAIKIYPLLFDLANEESIKSAMKELYSWKLPIDILVNNAGVVTEGLMLTTNISKIKEVFQVNYFSQVLLTQYILKLMMKNKKGNILFMSSVAGQNARSGMTIYGSSKAAIAMLAQSLAKEIAVYNIRVNALAPSLVETEMLYTMKENSFSDIIHSSALKRMASPEEIADAALFLVSDESSYITGQVIRVDGGL